MISSLWNLANNLSEGLHSNVVNSDMTFEKLKRVELNVIMATLFLKT